MGKWITGTQLSGHSNAFFLGTGNIKEHSKRFFKADSGGFARYMESNWLQRRGFGEEYMPRHTCTECNDMGYCTVSSYIKMAETGQPGMVFFGYSGITSCNSFYCGFYNGGKF